ncbi:MAG: hypothetical protein AAFU85_12525 [Planctomycetota bacterium]
MNEPARWTYRPRGTRCPAAMITGLVGLAEAALSWPESRNEF